MSVFTYIPAQGAKARITPVIRQAGFGDGYKQRQAEGINSFTEEWDLDFPLRETAVADAILAFFVAAGGVDSFEWTNPDGVTAKYVCKTWDHAVLNANRKSVTATFERTYEP